MAFHSDGKHLKISNIWDVAPNTQEAPNKCKSKYDGGVTLWEGPIHKRQWTDWVVHIKWSYRDDGPFLGGIDRMQRNTALVAPLPMQNPRWCRVVTRFRLRRAPDARGAARRSAARGPT